MLNHILTLPTSSRIRALDTSIRHEKVGLRIGQTDAVCRSAGYLAFIRTSAYTGYLIAIQIGLIRRSWLPIRSARPEHTGVGHASFLACSIKITWIAIIAGDYG